MSKALNATGRQILYSMCNWGQDQPFDWAYMIANSFRATGDVYDSFDRPDVRCPCDEKAGADCYWPGFHCSVMNIINKMVWTIQRSQPGGWNDLDMLEVGNVRCNLLWSTVELRLMFHNLGRHDGRSTYTDGRSGGLTPMVATQSLSRRENLSLRLRNTMLIAVRNIKCI